MFGSLRRRVEMENGRKLTVNVNGYIYNMIIAATWRTLNTFHVCFVINLRLATRHVSHYTTLYLLQLRMHSTAHVHLSTTATILLFLFMFTYNLFVSC